MNQTKSIKNLKKLESLTKIVIKVKPNNKFQTNLQQTLI